MRILITGGAGFIGSNLVRFLIDETEHHVLNLDKLTYAGNLNSLADICESERYEFVHGDICNSSFLDSAIASYQPDAIMHLAAESHVDRSIDGPDAFIQTNIVGTFNLLHSARTYYEGLEPESKERFRFHHISTDEVYGSLSLGETGFSETTPYDPHSPYSASKAASDHLVRTWHDTYSFPVVLSNCSNNYGPYQFPEKLVPVVILKAICGNPIPVYGKGENIRDWLYVTDHARALYAVLTKGATGQTYNVGGNNERQNIELVRMICGLLDDMHPIATNPELDDETRAKLNGYADLITFVTDRPGHDLRYAINADKIESELGWKPEEDFESGFRKTVAWYLNNRTWWEQILSGQYQLQRQGLES